MQRTNEYPDTHITVPGVTGVQVGPYYYSNQATGIGLKMLPQNVIANKDAEDNNLEFKGELSRVIIYSSAEDPKVVNDGRETGNNVPQKVRYFEGNILEPSSATTATDSTITSSNIPPVPTNTSGATPATDSTINSGDTPPVPTTTSNATTITSSDTAVVPTTTSSAVPLNASSLEDMKIKYKYLISIKKFK